MLQQYREGTLSTVNHMGAVFLVDSLLELTQKQEHPSQIEVSELVWVLGETEVDQVRVAKADTSFPLIVLQERSGRLVVLDGAHRLTKLVECNKQFANCYIVTEDELEGLNHG